MPDANGSGTDFSPPCVLADVHFFTFFFCQISGHELFDLYGGNHPTSNVDLLMLFGFASSTLPSDTMGLVMFVCPESSAGADPDMVRDRTNLLHATLARFESFYSSAPLAIDELLDEHEYLRYDFAQARFREPSRNLSLFEILSERTQ